MNHHANRTVTRADGLDDWPATPDARYYTQTQIDAAGYYASPYIESLGGGGLVVNGGGFYGDNTNFTDFTFDSLVRNSNAGSFRYGGAGLHRFTDALIPISSQFAYRYSVSARVSSGNNTPKFYSGLAFFDIDGNAMDQTFTWFYNGTLSELTRDYTPGDSDIYVDNVTGWDFSGASEYHRGIMVWDYQDSYGFSYPTQTYTRRVIRGLWETTATPVDEGGGEWSIPLNTSGYTLTNIGASEVIPSGTFVSCNGRTGGTYKYIAASNVSIPDDGEWHEHAGYIGGVDYTGTQKTNSFAPGAAYVKIQFLPNYTGSPGATDYTYIANVDLRVAPEVNMVEDGSVVTTGPAGTIDYYRGFRPTATSGSVSSTTVIP